MIYAVAVSVPLAIAAVLLERAVALRQWPRRVVWAGMLIAIVLLTVAMPWQRARRNDARPITRVAMIEPGSRGVLAELESQAARSGWSAVTDRLDAMAMAVLDAGASRDGLARWIGILGSAGVAVVYLCGRWTLARRRRTWRRALVRDHSIFVASDDGPAVVGALSPQIVLPDWALSLDPRAIDLMLRHERAHQRARDPLLMHVAGLAVLLMPWNPLAWWMVSRLRLAIELDCDARVLRAGDRSAPSRETAIYGKLLIAVASHRSPRRFFAAPAMLEHSSMLTRRISAMYPTPRRFPLARTTAAGSAAVLTVALALLVPAPRLKAHTAPPAAISPVTRGDVVLVPTMRPGRVPPAKAATRSRPVVAKPAQAQVYQPGDGVKTPVIIKSVDPQYSREAMEAKIQGIVLLDAVVDRNGLLSNIKVVKSLDATLGLDQAAIDAAKKWLFKPGEKDGTPVAVQVRLEMEFRLGSPRNAPQDAPPPQFGKGAYPENTPRLVAPKPTRVVDPQYTSEAMRAKIQGDVKIEMVIQPDGSVGDKRIVESLDKLYGLDDSALKAASACTFEPGTLDGTPVAVIVTLTFKFRLH